MGKNSGNGNGVCRYVRAMLYVKLKHSFMLRYIGNYSFLKLAFYEVFFIFVWGFFVVGKNY